MNSREIFSNGTSVSGYILAEPGIGLKNSVFPSGKAFLTSALVGFLFFSKSNCLSISFFTVVGSKSIS